MKFHIGLPALYLACTDGSICTGKSAAAATASAIVDEAAIQDRYSAETSGQGGSQIERSFKCGYR